MLAGFTAHAIAYDGGQTRAEPPLETTPIFTTALAALHSVLPPGARIADVGCLEAGYAIGFARAGYTVLALEGQAENVARARAIAAAVELPHLTIVHDDARHLDAYGPQDAIFCSGVLYHLDDPVGWLALAAQVAPVLLLRTHVAIDAPRFPLGPWTIDAQGYRGRWFPEAPGPWSSVGNARSFWLEEAALTAALADAGYTTVTPVDDPRTTTGEWVSLLATRAAGG